MNDKDLIKEIFPDWPKWKRNMIRIERGTINSQMTIAMLEFGNTQMYHGFAICDEKDVFNEETGQRIALINLRKRIEEARKLYYGKTWIPKHGERYITIRPFTEHNGVDKNWDIISTVWRNDPVDYARLAMSHVFKNYRQARKYIRALEIAGRRIKNELKQIP